MARRAGIDEFYANLSGLYNGPREAEVECEACREFMGQDENCPNGPPMFYTQTSSDDVEQSKPDETPNE